MGLDIIIFVIINSMTQLSRFPKASFIKPTLNQIQSLHTQSPLTISQKHSLSIIAPSNHTTAPSPPKNPSSADSHRYTIASSIHIRPDISKPKPRLPTPIPVPTLNRIVLAEVKKQIADLKSIENLGLIIPHCILQVNPFLFSPCLFFFYSDSFFSLASILPLLDHVQVLMRVSSLILCVYSIIASLIVNLLFNLCRNSTLELSQLMRSEHLPFIISYFVFSAC